jgi:hypothetical protein
LRDLCGIGHQGHKLGELGTERLGLVDPEEKEGSTVLRVTFPVKSGSSRNE